MVGKLQDSWEGPYVVMSKLGPVNYRIKEDGGREKVKVVHIKNCKLYVEREEFIGTVTVYAEEDDFCGCEALLDEEVCEVWPEYKWTRCWKGSEQMC